MSSIKLGLIGVGIARSRAPELHQLAGQLCGASVSYDLTALESDLPSAFDRALAMCRASGYRGVNVTHPFKERAAQIVEVSKPLRRLGAVNTVCFSSDGSVQGFNTDYSGFKEVFRSRLSEADAGPVAVIGAGGVGRAIAFGLVDLGVPELRLFDEDSAKAEKLAGALHCEQQVQTVICKSVAEATRGAAGLVNATPLGMYQYPGTPVPRALMSGQRWAFDAVYTPVETRFLLDAAQAGLEVVSGYELFFYQGVHAFELFTGLRVDAQRLREALAVAG